MTTEYSTELSPLLPEASTASGVQPRGINIKRLLRLRAWLMITVFVVLAVPSSIAAWVLTPVKFQASAILRFASTRQDVLRGPESVQGSSYDKYVKTQVNLIASPAILSRVQADPAIRSLSQVAKADDTIQFLSGVVSARNQPGSELVTVSCEMLDPSAAFLIVKKVVEEYAAYDAQQASTVGGQRRQLLKDNVDLRDKELRETGNLISSLRKKLDMPETSVGSEFGYSATLSFNQNLTQAQADLTTANTEVGRLQNAINGIQALIEQCKKDPDQEIYEFGIEDRVTADMRVGTLRGRISSMEAENAQLSDTYNEGAPQLKVAQNNLASLKEKLVKTQHDVRQETLSSTLAKYQLDLDSAKKSVEGAATRVSEFEKRLADHQKNLADMSATMSQIKELEDKQEDAKRWRDRIQDIIDQIDLNSNAPASVSIASQPTKPTKPDYGTRFQLLLMAIAASLGSAAGVGVIRELSDQQLRSGQDVSYVTNLPILATVPHASADLLPKDVSAALLTADHPSSSTADEYRRILTRIIYPPEGSAELNTCLVVSPSRGDGKTSLACNLAISLAQANRRVLLLDISTRHPSIEHCFDMEPAEGLGEILANKYSHRDFCRPTGIANLCVLGPGFHGNDLVGKLASRDTVEFLEHAEEEFEHVIIDTPPSLLMSDARLLAPIVDGVIVVAGVGVSTIGMLRRCLQELQQGGANIIGVVLNGIRPTRGGYMSDKVEQYYAYSEGRTPHIRSERELPEMEILESGDSADEMESMAPAVILVEDQNDVAEDDGESRV